MVAAGVAVLGALGVLFSAAWGLGPADAAPATVRPLGLAWLGLIAPTCGALAASAGPAALAVPLVWLALAASLGAPVSGLAAAGLFGIGVGLGLRWPASRVGVAGGLLLVSALLVALPSCAGIAGHAPWSPPTTARLLDLSPAVLIVEFAGIDWLRHPAVYGPAGGDAIGPSLRVPWSGPLAVTVLLLLGVALPALLPRTRAPQPNP